jgi:hypothetical protein
MADWPIEYNRDAGVNMVQTLYRAATLFQKGMHARTSFVMYLFCSYRSQALPLVCIDGGWVPVEAARIGREWPYRRG